MHPLRGRRALRWATRWDRQIYPNTHTSTAVEGRAKYYLPYRAAASLSYRYFNDTWGIRAQHRSNSGTPSPSPIRGSSKGRFASLHPKSARRSTAICSPSPDSQNFEARDQNLAGSTTNYHRCEGDICIRADGLEIFKRGTVTGDVSRISFKYSDFRDIKDYGIANGYSPAPSRSTAFQRPSTDLRFHILLTCRELRRATTPIAWVQAPRYCQRVRHPIPEIPIPVHEGQPLHDFDERAEAGQ